MMSTLACQTPPLVNDTRDSPDGRSNAAVTFFAVAGPALRTVSVQVAFRFTLTGLGHDNATERSALFDGGGGVGRIAPADDVLLLREVRVLFLEWK